MGGNVGRDNPEADHKVSRRVAVFQPDSSGAGHLPAGLAAGRPPYHGASFVSFSHSRRLLKTFGRTRALVGSERLALNAYKLIGFGSVTGGPKRL